MEEYFLDKYQSKTKIELQRIVDNKEHYQPDAVLAASKLLYLRLNEKLPQILGDSVNESKGENIKVDRISLSFDYHPFFRTLSYREFLTSISIALFYLAVFEIIDYYSDERFFEDSQGTWKWFTLLLVFLINHILYRFEHNRSNNLIGRSINDLFLLVSIFLIRSSYALIVDISYDFSVDASVMGVVLVLFILPFFIFAFEIGVGILKYLLKIIRCQIF
ncbi:hypothetical protein V8V91_14965 [Algoriphagus halophilus]|uniref:hypothetical protein n=1 Tax=Algoriphagus halophilus TaxID=226505 RepID=UPI00358DED28